MPKKACFILGILVGLILGLIVQAVTAHGEATKNFKFFDFGTYTVPESLPDKFLDFQSRALACEYIAGGKAELLMIEYRFSGSPNHFLIVRIVAYLTKDESFILCLKTVSITDMSDIKKWKVVDYVNMSLYETGKPSLVLVETTQPIDFPKFIDRMSIILGRVRI